MARKALPEAESRKDYQRERRQRPRIRARTLLASREIHQRKLDEINRELGELVERARDELEAEVKELSDLLAERNGNG